MLAGAQKVEGAGLRGGGGGCCWVARLGAGAEQGINVAGGSGLSCSTEATASQGSREGPLFVLKNTGGGFSLGSSFLNLPLPSEVTPSLLPWGQGQPFLLALRQLLGQLGSFLLLRLPPPLSRSKQGLGKGAATCKRKV